MRITNVERLWLGGGAVIALLLTAVAWFLLVSPQNTETNGLLDQTVSTDTQISTLHQRLNELRAQSANLPSYQADLERDRAALPVTPELSSFLRELRSAEAAVGVEVTSLTAAQPVPVTAADAKLESVTVTMIAKGPAGDLTAFVTQLQRAQPRAALVESVRLSMDPDGTVTVNLTAQVFVAPQAQKSG